MERLVWGMWHFRETLHYAYKMSQVQNCSYFWSEIGHKSVWNMFLTHRENVPLDVYTTVIGIDYAHSKPDHEQDWLGNGNTQPYCPSSLRMYH